MAGKTILELSAAAAAAAADKFLIRKDAETADRSITGTLLATFIQNAAVIDNASFEVLTGTDAQTLWEQNDVELLNARSTGVRYGGALTDQGSGVIRIAAGGGGILDNSTPSTPTYTAITWSQTDLDLSAADGVYFIYVNSSGTVVSTTTMPNHSEYRTGIYLHRVSIRSGVYSASTSIVQPLQQYGPQIWDIWRSLGPIKRGFELSAASTNLTIAIASGEVYEAGSNFYTDPTSPHETEISAKNPATFRHVDQDGDQTADRTALDVGNYDLGGTITAIPGASTRAQIFTVKMFPGSGGNVRIFYGQEFFSSVDEAEAALQGGLHNPILPSIYNEAVTLGWIIAQSGAINLADGTQKFITANRFGLTGGAIASSGANPLLASNNLSDLNDASISRTNLGLAIGSDVQAWDADLDAIAALAKTDGNIIVGNGTTWVAESGATARTSLGLGTADSPQFIGVNVGNVSDTTITRASAGVIAVEGDNVLMASNIGNSVQGYDAGLQSISGLTTLADRMIYTTALDTYDVTPLTSFARTLIDDASALDARSTLGLSIGTDVQAYNTNLAAIASLAVTDGNIIVGNGSTFVAESGATARTSLGLTIGTDVQAYDAELTAIAGLTSAANKVPYFTGSGTADLLDFIDDDTFATASATSLPSSESTKAYVDNKSNVGSARFTSSETTITASSTSTIAHGLGAVPKLVMLKIICKTAEYGYSIGDVLYMSMSADNRATNNAGSQVEIDATNVYVHYSSNQPFAVVNKSTFAVTSITPANWKVIVEAW